ncbi:MAG: T9SS type A sorting domain-containing protein, partial [Bacteroidetes bacterium]|nr:T9SS type A sorting domain-containing protein [Bacteroidota bacterium]
SQEVWLNNQTGCENWFWYENTFENHFVFHGESWPYPASQYFWDFGDGSTGFGQITEHNFDPAAGEVFIVTLTTILNDPAIGDSCIAASSQEVWIGGQTGDCYNWFWYESQSPYEFTFHGESEPPSELYVWMFENGTVEYGQEITHSFDPSSGDVHIVCLTTYHYGINFMDSCSYTSCQEVILGGPVGVEKWGNIYTGDAPADFALVGLFGMTPAGGFTYDFTVTQGSMYFFENVQPGNYYIFASLTPQSQYFFDYFPTYYGDATFWSDATLITLGEPQNPYNISMIPLEGTASGPGNIFGLVTAGDSKAGPIGNITVVLMDQDENALAYMQSNENGEFGFENIALGTYKLKVEIPGKPCEVATVSLTDENLTGSVTFIVKDTEVVLTIKGNTAFASYISDIFPNPVAEDASLTIGMMRPADLTVRILNQLGQEVQSVNLSLTAGEQVLRIEASGLTSGFYTLQIADNDGRIMVKKFVK